MAEPGMEVDRLADATDLSSLMVALSVCAPSEEFPDGIQGRFSGTQCAVLFAALERIPELERMLDEAIDLNMRQAQRLERAERVEAAARAVMEDHDPEPWAAKVFDKYPELAGTKRRYELLADLRTALAAAPGTGETSR